MCSWPPALGVVWLGWNEGVVLFCQYMTDSMLGGLLVHMKVDYT